MERCDVGGLLVLIVVFILGIRVGVDLQRTTDQWQLDVAPHHVWWGVHTTAIQQRGQNLPSTDLGPYHVVAWWAKTGRGVLRRVRG